MEYAKYPFKNMKITQNIGDGNHLPHWKGSTNYSDKPWDEAGKDGGQDVFAPLNDFKIIKILGLNTTVTTNTVILQSVNKLTLPYGKTDYLYLTLTHINEPDLRQLKVGQIIKAGQTINAIREGVDGQATGNHLHITANIGKYYGLKENSNGKYCYVYEKSLKPEEAFYLDKKHTTVYSTKGSIFKEVPKTQYYPIYKGSSASLVDALKKMGIDSSFVNRKKIAKANGISVYVGTASQNTKLLNLLKNGKLVK